MPAVFEVIVSRNFTREKIVLHLVLALQDNYKKFYRYLIDKKGLKICGFSKL